MSEGTLCNITIGLIIYLRIRIRIRIPNCYQGRYIQITGKMIPGDIKSYGIAAYDEVS